ncbi:MAG: RHS repeat-associated core domain-containing protein, partial [Vicinamibacterales bacterium]
TTRVAYSSDPPGPAGATTGDRRVFVRDGLGRLVRAESATGLVAISYGADGLPLEVQSDGSPPLRYTSDVFGRLSAMQVGAGPTIRYRYDYLGRLAALATPAGDITYTYQAGLNTVVRRLPNGVQTFWKYDDEGRLWELTHADGQSRVIAAFSYSYRPDGLLAGISEGIRDRGRLACRYEYDLMHRLTAFVCSGDRGPFRYRYDALGNLVESQAIGAETTRFSSTPAGAPASDSRGVVRVDARGHVRQLPASGASRDFDFTPAGELASVEHSAVKYLYNALGLLTGRVVDGRTTTYLPNPFADAWQPLWQRDADGAETVTVWDGAVPLMRLRGDRVSYQLEDHLASTRVEVDANGQAVSWHDYTPYGGPLVPPAGDELTPGFAGLFWDPTAEVYHAMARAYDPVTARFLQPDPQLRVPDVSPHNHSLYAYGGSDPVNFVDRNGAQARPAMLTDGRGLAVSGRTVPMPLSVAWLKHRNRNWDHQNRFPDGKLTPKSTADPLFQYNPFGNNDYVDESGLTWTLMPDQMNAFHQPEYPLWRALLGGLDPRKKTYKFLNAADGGGSHEAIFLPGSGETNFFDGGHWLNTGPHGSTYNFVNPRNPFQFTPPPSAMAGGSSQPLGLTGALAATAVRIVSPWKILQVVPSWSNHDRQDVFPSEQFGDDYRRYAPDMPYGARFRPEIIGPARELTDRLMSLIDAHTKLQRQLDTTGREGLVAGPGGYPSNDAERAASSARAGQPTAPSPLGGVALGGAGLALRGFSHLQGVAIDDTTRRLVLIGADEQHIALPSLRLDDIVTVFRAVFEHGQAPTVTIDPDGQQPTGPIMHVKHGPGTAGTYVGWILYECDRLMKSYQLGRDNITGATIASRLPDHSATVDAVFFGDAKRSDGPSANWERFWIVPAEVVRFDAATVALSLFEVPLKVNTQKMRWDRGQLVDDLRGASSSGARAFQQWFTDHFDAIADEVRLTPPLGAGIDTPVPIFHELRRIATVAAVAERLRDLGHTLPVWMRDYAVTPFPLPQTTPALLLRQTKDEGATRRVAQIYGGVNLAPADGDVHAYRAGAEASTVPLPREHRVFVDAATRTAAWLTPVIANLARTTDSVTAVQRLAAPDGTMFSVAVLPGPTSRALLPNRQQVDDLVVPIGGGRQISLTRSYNSFFDPAGEFGQGWTLDLPRWTMTPVPVTRDGTHAEYRLVPQVRSPLGTTDIRFAPGEPADRSGVRGWVAPEQPDVIGVAKGRSQLLGAETNRVLFRDGTTWQFDDTGRLLLVAAEGTATRYVWGASDRLVRIVGHLGTEAVAEIRLTHDNHGRIVEAVATQAMQLRQHAPAPVSRVKFEYGDNGRLLRVSHPATTGSDASPVHRTYTYEDHLLKTIDGNDAVNESFGYDELGRVLWAQQGDQKTEHAITETALGTVLRTTTGRQGGSVETWTFDRGLRPLEADYGGGEVIRWRYGSGRELQETRLQDGRPMVTRSVSEDGHTETTAFAVGPTYTVQRDASERSTDVFVNALTAAQIAWDAEGALVRVRTGDTELHPRRDTDGRTTGVLISAPMERGRTTQWLEALWDVMGRPTTVTDSSGFTYRVQYDE